MGASDHNIDFKTFSRLCDDDVQWLKTYEGGVEAYVNRHIVRFYHTYITAARLLKPNSRVLSVGGGPSIIERQLRRQFGCQIAVLDAPEVFENTDDEVYNRDNFRKIGIDLIKPWTLAEEPFDLVFSCEVLEHLTVTPLQHISALAAVLKPGGYVVLSTPNLASLRKILGLLRGRPILPKPEDAFSPVIAQNNWVHRREYVASELTSAIAQAGLHLLQVEYIFNRVETHPTLANWCTVPLYALNKRFKPTLLVSAQKA